MPGESRITAQALDGLTTASAVLSRAGVIQETNPAWASHAAASASAALEVGGDYVAFLATLAPGDAASAALADGLGAILSGRSHRFHGRYSQAHVDGSTTPYDVEYLRTVSGDGGALVLLADARAMPSGQPRLPGDEHAVAVAISAAIAAAGFEPVDIATVITHQLVEQVGDQCILSLVDGASGEMRTISIEGSNTDAAVAARIAGDRPMRLDSPTLAAEAVRTRSTMVRSAKDGFGDGADPTWREDSTQFPVHHLLQVPAIAGNDVVAVVSLARMRDEPFSHSAVSLVETVARHAAYALQNALLYQAKDVAEQARRAAEVKLTYANHELKRAATNAMREADFSTVLLAAMREGYVYTVDGTIVDVNEQLCEMTGFTRDELIGQRRPYPFWPVDIAARYVAAAQAIRADGGGQLDVTLVTKSGDRFAAVVSAKPAPRVQGRPDGYITTVTDVTAFEKRESSTTEIDSRDPLTGLSDAETVDKWMTLLEAGDSVVVLELDAGHGDAALSLFGEYVAHTLRAGDWAGRLGTGEVAVVVRGGGDCGAEAVVSRLRNRWAESMPDIALTAGIASHITGIDPPATLDLAQTALRCANGVGRGRTEVLRHDLDRFNEAAHSNI